jgi:hypothetical protein
MCSRRQLLELGTEGWLGNTTTHEVIGEPDRREAVPLDERHEISTLVDSGGKHANAGLAQ